MTHSECETLLTQHNIKPTSNRILVVKTLGSAPHPMSLTELERQIQSIDKSGIFRSLTLFKEHHLVHTLEDGSANTRYELCHSAHHDTDDDLHLHFYCEHCHHTYCLTDTPPPAISLPAGFTPTSANYMIKGICPHCQNK